MREVFLELDGTQSCCKCAFTAALQVELESFGVDTPIFDMSVTSIDPIRLKPEVENRMKVKIPIVTMMQHPTIRSLATAL